MKSRLFLCFRIFSICLAIWSKWLFYLWSIPS